MTNQDSLVLLQSSRRTCTSKTYLWASASRLALNTMDEDLIKAFAKEFDPQPFHLDGAAAQATLFRGLAASGWHTAAVTMRLLVTGGLPLGNGIIGLGGDLTWHNPTRAGNTLHVESEIVEITPSKPNQAVVKVKSTTLNQEGNAVYVFTGKVLVFKRPSKMSDRITV